MTSFWPRGGVRRARRRAAAPALGKTCACGGRLANGGGQRAGGECVVAFVVAGACQWQAQRHGVSTHWQIPGMGKDKIFANGACQWQPTSRCVGVCYTVSACPPSFYYCTKQGWTNNIITQRQCLTVTPLLTRSLRRSTGSPGPHRHPRHPDTLWAVHHHPRPHRHPHAHLLALLVQHPGQGVPPVTRRASLVGC